jgi:hypothetical protein
MPRRIDRHNWFADYGDLISDCVKVPEHAPDYPWSCMATQAFYRLAYNKEDNDCGVRALAVACAAPYAKAHEALQDAGRIAGYPCCIAQMMNAAALLHCHMVRTTCKAKTLLTVERELAKTHGGFIVATRDHVAGVWNGELIDHARGRLWRLDGIFRVEPLRSE